MSAAVTPNWPLARRWATVAFASRACSGRVMTNLPGLKERTGIEDSEVFVVVLSVLLMAAVGSLAAGWIAPDAGPASCSRRLRHPRRSRSRSPWIDLPCGALPRLRTVGPRVGLADAGNGMRRWSFSAGTAGPSSRCSLRSDRRGDRGRPDRVCGQRLRPAVRVGLRGGGRHRGGAGRPNAHPPGPGPRGGSPSVSSPRCRGAASSSSAW